MATLNFPWRLLIVIVFSVALVSPTRAQVTYGVNSPTLIGSKTDAVWKTSLETMHANGIGLVRTVMGPHARLKRS